MAGGELLDNTAHVEQYFYIWQSDQLLGILSDVKSAPLLAPNRLRQKLPPHLLGRRYLWYTHVVPTKEDEALVYHLGSRGAGGFR